MPKKDYDPIEDLDRSNEGNFIKYMLANPEYFYYVFGVNPSDKNVRMAYKEAMEIRAGL